MSSQQLSDTSHPGLPWAYEARQLLRQRYFALPYGAVEHWGGIEDGLDTLAAAGVRSWCAAAHLTSQQWTASRLPIGARNTLADHASDRCSGCAHVDSPDLQVCCQALTSTQAPDKAAQRLLSRVCAARTWCLAARLLNWADYTQDDALIAAVQCMSALAAEQLQRHPCRPAEHRCCAGGLTLQMSSRTLEKDIKKLMAPYEKDLWTEEAHIDPKVRSWLGEFRVDRQQLEDTLPGPRRAECVAFRQMVAMVERHLLVVAYIRSLKHRKPHILARTAIVDDYKRIIQPVVALHPHIESDLEFLIEDVREPRDLWLRRERAISHFITPKLAVHAARFHVSRYLTSVLRKLEHEDVAVKLKRRVGVRLVAGETHNKGKKPAFVRVRYLKEADGTDFRTVRLVYKPRSALVDTAVIALFRAINALPPEQRSLSGEGTDLPDYEIHPRPTRAPEFSLWERVPGWTPEERHYPDCYRAVHDHPYDDKKKRELMVNKFFRMGEVLHQLHVIDLHSANIIMHADTLDAVPIDLECVQKDLTPYGEFTTHLGGYRKFPLTVQEMDLIQALKAQLPHYTVRHLIAGTKQLAWFMCSSDCCKKLMRLLVNVLECRGMPLACRKDDLRKWILHDYLWGDIPMFTQHQNVIYWGEPSSNRIISNLGADHTFTLRGVRGTDAGKGTEEEKSVDTACSAEFNQILEKLDGVVFESARQLWAGKARASEVKARAADLWQTFVRGNGAHDSLLDEDTLCVYLIEKIRGFNELPEFTVDSLADVDG
eukprot:CAMPEP_0177636060 /NCGR_PEP_ID=MMETSP0447-20121125/4234_1 /TAXON_ID=0 /ORGANISM="Stygamoeba regulata, Strain BSH-02190019" /LENGTH=768 /DNA_ID=CAMNT_0019137891 /DNA_START=16 /DNA_END=2322 /DNA_ORIENTATION=+